MTAPFPIPSAGSSTPGAAPVEHGRPAYGAPGARPRGRQSPEDVARQFEGVLVTEMFKSMRAANPSESEGDSARETFTSMLDGIVAGRATAGWKDGLTRALITRLTPAASASTVNASTSGSAQSPATVHPDATASALMSEQAAQRIRTITPAQETR